MKFCDTSRLLYLEADASEIYLGVRLWKVRHGMTCWHDVVPDSVTLHPNALPAKVYQVLSAVAVI